MIAWTSQYPIAGGKSVTVPGGLIARPDAMYHD
jgi:hypothetical protein